MNAACALSLKRLFPAGVVCAVLLWVPAVGEAQFLTRLEIPSSPNPVGSGARALGMGGAFIAVADDATAASWNPGGLVQLESPEISIVGAAFSREEDNTFNTRPEASGSQSVSEADLNYLSLSYPFSLMGRNMVASLNYQSLYDFEREWRFPLRSASATLSLNTTYDYNQTGGLSAIGIAYCIQVTPTFSFGFTFNIWDDWVGGNEWEQTTRENGSGTWTPGPVVPIDVQFYRRDNYSVRGFNASGNLGVLWNATDRLTLGAVYKTPFTVKLRHEYESRELITSSVLGTVQDTALPLTATDEELDMPMSYGIGSAYRFSDRMTVSLDVYRTEWEDFVLRDSSGRETSPITGLSTSESDIGPTHQVRMGGEYLIIQPKYVVPIRCGIFYDPAPAQGSPDDFFGFSVGTGIGIGRFIFDVAYQYRFGKDVGSSILQGLGFSQDVDEHTLYGSLIVHF